MEFLQVIQKGALLAFLICSMGGIGMHLEPRALLALLGRPSFIIIALVLNFVLAPALAWAITMVLPLRSGHATGLLLLGAAAGAPFLPKLAEISRDPVTSATALLVLLIAGTVLFMPLMLPWMIPGVHAEPRAIARPMVMLLLLPLALGILAKAALPRMAAILGPMFGRVGSVSLLLLFVLLVALNISGLLAVVGTGAIAAALLHTAGVFVIAWTVLAVEPGFRGVQSLCVSARNFGAAMVPAAGPLADPDVMIMIVGSAVVGLLVCSLEAVWLRGRRPDSRSGGQGISSP